MSPTAPAALDTDRLVAGFVRYLRRGGLSITLSQSLTFRNSLDIVGTSDGIDVYWAGRSTLVVRREEIPMYDAMFLAFFHHNSSGFTQRFDEVIETLGLAGDHDGDGSTADVKPAITLRYSPSDSLSDKNFAEFSAEELREAEQVMARMRLQPSTRRSRRRRPRRTGDRLDLRRTARAAMRTGGEPIKLAVTTQADRTRRLVLLLDVSGSMEPYARVMIRFAHAAVIARGNVEVFALGTRLTRLTRQLGTHDVDEAVNAAAASALDWSGGTRLGATLGEFNREWGLRGMARGATLVVVSDGWDRGDPTEMDEAMTRLHRAAHRVIWVNPLKAGPGYEPTAKGMAAALPHIDTFLEGHSLRSLSALADAVAT